MRIFFSIAVAILFLSVLSGCKSSNKTSDCDAACPKDTLKFSNPNHKLKPYVYVSVKDCKADTAIWSYSGLGRNWKLELPAVQLNKDLVHCIINDTSNAWLFFNDCNTKRGFYLKVLFSKVSGRINPYAINNLDKKFAVGEGLAAYTDKGNLFVEDITTGKQAMMTFGEQLDFDFDAIHKTLDSVNITPQKIWAKVKVNGEWKELQKDITLQ
jgi:hypothetical protein